MPNRERQDSRPALRSLRRIRILEGGPTAAREAVKPSSPTASTCISSSPGSTIASKNLTTPKPSWPPPASSPKKTKKKTPSSKPASRTTRPPAGSRSASTHCAKNWKPTARSTAAAWCVLARYLEADTKLPEAVRAAERAVLVDPRSIPAWTLPPGARIGRQPGRRRRCSAPARRDRPPQSHRALTGMARLEARLGRVERLEGRPRPAGGRAGKSRKLRVLRPALLRAGQARGRPRCPAQGGPRQPSETASSSSWPRHWPASIRPMRRSRCTGGHSTGPRSSIHKLDVVRKLTELYLQRGQLDRLFARLQQRSATIGHLARPAAATSRCAWHRPMRLPATWGRPRRAREAAGHRYPRHPVARAAIQAGRGRGRPGNRRPLSKAARRPGQKRRRRARLAGSSRQGRRTRGSSAVWAKAAAGKSQSFRVFMAMDNLLSHEKPLPVLEITETMLRDDPRRLGGPLPAGTRPGTARQAPGGRTRFQKLVELAVGDDEKAQWPGRGEEPQAPGLGWHDHTPSRPPPGDHAARGSNRDRPLDPPRLQARDAAARPRQQWSPADFGQARMAALGWLVSLAEKEQPAG